MVHPLRTYRAIAKPNFIANLEDKFFTEYYNYLLSGFDVEKDEENGILRISGFDLYNRGIQGDKTFSSYLIDECNKMEEDARKIIDETILTFICDKKKADFVNTILTELQVLYDGIKELKLKKKYEILRPILLNQIDSFSKLLNALYKPQKQQAYNLAPKIQWLETTNLLTTLFYDLLNGQKKAKKGAKNTRPFIKAKTTDIEKLLIENFLDSEGKELSPETIKTYLNNSRPETRVREGGRIELEF
jgi:hypothetical protein